MVISITVLCYTYPVTDHCILQLLFYCVVSSTAPGAPPQNLITRSFALGTITLSWSAPPVDRQYGNIMEYFVTYRVSPNGDISERSFTGPGANLTGLLSNTLYIITITAANNIDRSPFDVNGSQMTIDDRKLM